MSYFTHMFLRGFQGSGLSKGSSFSSVSFPDISSDDPLQMEGDDVMKKNIHWKIMYGYMINHGC